jgi:WXG100 family type VII secretion target
MNFLQFLRVDVGNVMATVGQQKQITEGTLDQIKGYVPKIQAAWVGDDATEFGNDVMRKIVPAMVELIAAIAGINLNLTKATNIVDQADSQCKSLAEDLGGTFGQI